MLRTGGVRALSRAIYRPGCRSYVGQAAPVDPLSWRDGKRALRLISAVTFKQVLRFPGMTQQGRGDTCESPCPSRAPPLCPSLSSCAVVPSLPPASPLVMPSCPLPLRRLTTSRVSLYACEGVFLRRDQCRVSRSTCQLAVRHSS